MKMMNIDSVTRRCLLGIALLLSGFIIRPIVERHVSAAGYTSVSYKVLNTASIEQKCNTTPGVQDAGECVRVKVNDNLNELGKDGWTVVAAAGPFVILKR